MSFKQKSSPLKQGFIRKAAALVGRSITGQSAEQNWKNNYWENKRKADWERGKAEVKAELLSRQKTPVINTFDRAGNPIKPNPNTIVQPPQPPPPVEIIPQIAVSNNNSDYNLRNMTQNQQAPVNPNAFTNQGNIQGIYGQSMPGTFNRSINSPFTQMVDPLTGLTIDPTMSQDPNAPLPPPAGVQTPTTPIYDINNY